MLVMNCLMRCGIAIWREKLLFATGLLEMYAIFPGSYCDTHILLHSNSDFRSLVSVHSIKRSVALSHHSL